MKKIYFNVDSGNDKIKLMQYVLSIGFFNCGFDYEPEQRVYINLNNGSLLIVNFNMSKDTLIDFSRDIRSVLNGNISLRIKKHYHLIS